MNKKHPNWKGGSKTVIIHRRHESILRKPYSLHQKALQSPLDLVSGFDKIAGYKVNIQKPIAFLYTNTELSQTETRKKNPIYYSNKKNKAPKNKFNQGDKRLVLRKLQNTEKKFRKIQKMEAYIIFMDWKN